MGKGGRYFSDTLPLNKTILEIQNRESDERGVLSKISCFRPESGLRTTLVQPIPEA